MNSFDILINDVKAHLHPYTHRKSNNNFYIKVNGSWCSIRFQKSWSSDRENIKFTINISISQREANKGKGLPKKTHPDKLVYYMGDRIGFFLPENKDYWWAIDGNNKTGAISKEIISILDDVVIPFFERYTDINNLLAYLQNDKSIRWFNHPFNKLCFHILILKGLNKEVPAAMLQELKQTALNDGMEIQYDIFVDDYM